ncbi:MAG: DUF3299 domain-containing protein [Gemmatimonadaceae bacterium]
MTLCIRRPVTGLLIACAALLLSARASEAQSRPSVVPVAIDWRLLAGLDYENGKMTDTLKKLDGKTVRVPGFVVPLDDAAEEGAEFLLVPYYGACVHTPPPPPNQMALVQMAGKRSVRLGLFDAVWMEGTLRVKNVDSPYGQVGFEIEGLSMKPYTGK